jgi:hypothetical protein
MKAGNAGARGARLDMKLQLNAAGHRAKRGQPSAPSTASRTSKRSR